MQNTNRSWGLVAGLALVALGQTFFGCTNPGGTGDDDDVVADSVTRQALAQVGPGVVLPALERFKTDAVALDAAVAAWQAAVDGGGDSVATLTAAQAAFKTAMATWQELEVLQIGPAASSLKAVAGADQRDQVYSWPTVNRCLVDQQTVVREWDTATFFTGRRADAVGLDALEVLLFSPATENGCPPSTEPNKSGAWAELGEDGIASARAGYGAVLTAEIVRVTDGLTASWSPDGDDFSAQLASAGTETSPYVDDIEALNAVYDALFYVELRTKDRKLMRPLGLKDCPDGDCADETELRLSGASVPAIAANLKMFRTLFTGGDGAGMDDVLIDLGHEELVTQLLAELDIADAAAAAVTQPIDVQLADDAAPVQTLFEEVRAVTDLLKGDITTLLAMQIPSEAAGDND